MKNSSKEAVIQFKARIENGVLVPTEAVQIPSSGTYVVTLKLELESDADAATDALAEIVAMAQPLGPSDLARNFDTYTKRVIDGEPAE